MTPKEIAVEHLHTLNLALSDWQRYASQYALADLRNDRDVQNMVLHALLLGIQSSIDIANRLIAYFGLPKASSYRESFATLASYGYLDEENAADLQDLAGFRNIVVHVYWQLDLKRVDEILHTKSDVLKDFMQQVKALIK